MSAVTQYTSASIVDTKIQLGEDQMVRTIDITGSWNILRVGSRICVSSSYSRSLASPTTNLKFFYGICSTTQSAFADSASLNACGISWHQQANWYSDLKDYGGMVSSSLDFLEVTVRTFAQSSSYYSQFSRRFVAAKYPNRSMCIVEFRKTTSSMYVQSLLPNYSASVYDTTLEDLTGSILQPTMSFSGYEKYGPTLVPYTANSGSIDSVNIYWGSAYKPLEVSEIVYTVIN